MSAKTRLVGVIALALAALIAPNLIWPAAPAAAGLIGLGGLGVVLGTLVAGVRVGVLSALATGVAGGVAVLGDGRLLVGIAVMVAAAIGLGLTARWQWSRGFIVLPITLAFVAAESPSQEPLASGVAFGSAMAGYGVVTALAASILRPHAGEAASTHVTSWSRTWGYAGMLAVTAIATTVISLSVDWGHAGGWLMMTPFIVIQPYIHDGLRKAVNRAAGTLGGFLVASLLDQVFGPGAILTAAGLVLAVLAAVAMIEKWSYALYALFLTPAIVILESVGRPLQQTDDNRLLATMIGVGLSLVAMAVAVPMYRRGAPQAGG